jgi:hypothetical protein
MFPRHTKLKPLNYFEEPLPLEGTSSYICDVCEDPLSSYSHRNACDISANIKKWAREGTLLDHCTVGSMPPLEGPHF